MREGSLVAFTLLTQAAAGTCALLLAFEGRAVRAGAGASVASAALPILSFALVAALLGLAASFLHLGNPRNAVRALGNLRSSWLSREILLAALFSAALAAATLLRVRPGPAGFAAGFAHGLAAVAGFGLVVTMARAYRLRTVPAWDLPTTPVAFFATAVALGALAVAAGLALRGPGPTDPARGPVPLLAAGLVVLVVALASGLLWLRRLAGGNGAQREAFARTGRTQRRLVAARIALTALAVAAGLATRFAPDAAWPVVAALVLAFAAEAAGRVLFYEARVRSGL
ncbi:MAG: DmsC/YnfH family molybdoenzyme membrane anchor subunit [Thermoanaerobaculia bacterium]